LRMARAEARADTRSVVDYGVGADATS
jgi:hypothetical protein